MSDLRQEFIAFSVEAEVLKFGQFTTKAGRLSPYFFNAGLFHDGATLGKLAQRRAVMEQAGVEEIRRLAPCLGGEFTEAQYLGLHRKRNKLLAQIAHVLLLLVRKRVL